MGKGAWSGQNVCVHARTCHDQTRTHTAASTTAAAARARPSLAGCVERCWAWRRRRRRRPTRGGGGCSRCRPCLGWGCVWSVVVSIGMDTAGPHNNSTHTGINQFPSIRPFNHRRTAPRLGRQPLFLPNRPQIRPRVFGVGVDLCVVCLSSFVVVGLGFVVCWVVVVVVVVWGVNAFYRTYPTHPSQRHPQPQPQLITITCLQRRLEISGCLAQHPQIRAGRAPVFCDV